MIEALTWILTGLSVVGVVLNIQKNRNGFAIWMATNASWAIIDFFKGIPQQGALFVVYFVLAVWGYLTWLDDETKRPVSETVRTQADLSVQNGKTAAMFGIAEAAMIVQKKLEDDIAKYTAEPFEFIGSGDIRTAGQSAYSMEFQEPITDQEA